MTIRTWLWLTTFASILTPCSKSLHSFQGAGRQRQWVAMALYRSLEDSAWRIELWQWMQSVFQASRLPDHFLSSNSSQIFQNFPVCQPSTKSNLFFKNPFEDSKKNTKLSHRIHGHGIFPNLWSIFVVNVGKHVIHGSYGSWMLWKAFEVCSLHAGWRRDMSPEYTSMKNVE